MNVLYGFLLIYQLNIIYICFMLQLKKIGFLSFLVFFSCLKQPNTNWDSDFVLPIANSSLNIKNFFGDTLLKPDNNGLLSFVFNRELLAIKLDSLINIPDTSIIQNFVNPSPFPSLINPGQSLIVFQPSDLRFDIGNNVSIKTFAIRKGNLKVKFSNDLDQPLDLVYAISSAKKNDSVFKIRETIPPGINSLIKNYDLSGYTLNMRGISGNAYNTIIQNYNISLNSNASTTTVNPGKGAKIDLTYTQISPDFVEGYFGQQVISIPEDTLGFSFMETLQASNFLLSEANVAFRIINEFGAEFSGNLNNIKSINSSNNSIVNLNTTLLSNLNINRATKSAFSLFPSNKFISLNSQTNNVAAFISNLPNKLTFKGSVSLNPLGNISGYNDFAFYNTGIKVLADINIPLRFKANYFRLKSIAKVDFSNVNQLDQVKQGNLIINTINGYPFKAKLQAYLLDDQNLIMDSLFLPNENILESGIINSQNEVISSSSSNINIPISDYKIKLLKKCKSIQFVTYFITPTNSSDIKIMENYEFKINIVAELSYNISIKRN